MGSLMLLASRLNPPRDRLAIPNNAVKRLSIRTKVNQCKSSTIRSISLSTPTSVSSS